MARTLPLLVVLVLLLASCGDPPAPFSVMTFNIRFDTPSDGPNQWSRGRRFLAARLIEGAAPDLVALQEARGSQVTDLLRALPAYAEVAGPRREPDWRNFNSILYRRDRFEVLEQGLHGYHKKGTRGLRFPRFICWARLQDRVSGDVLHVVNNHFDHRLKSLRQEEALALTAFLESMQISSNLVITGDFNVGPTSPVYGYLTGRNFLRGQRQPRPLVDAYATGHPGRGTEVTLNAFQLPVPSYAERIDHIFLSPDLRAQSARIHSDTEDGFASDHYPVTATVIRER